MTLDDMTAEARRRVSAAVCSCMGPAPSQTCSTCLAAMIAREAGDRIALALVHVEGLRQEHATSCNDWNAGREQRVCYCGADKINARVDAALAALRGTK